MMSKRCDC